MLAVCKVMLITIVMHWCKHHEVAIPYPVMVRAKVAQVRKSVEPGAKDVMAVEAEHARNRALIADGNTGIHRRPGPERHDLGDHPRGRTHGRAVAFAIVLNEDLFSTGYLAEKFLMIVVRSHDGEIHKPVGAVAGRHVI